MSLLSFTDQIEHLKGKIELMNYILTRNNENKHNEYYTISYNNINRNCIHIYLLDDTKSKNYFLFTGDKDRLFHPYDIFLLQKVKLYDIEVEYTG